MNSKQQTETKIPEKKKAIYNAVCAFIEEGRDTATLTVSEITKRAGIGKGTAYEYFDSKEAMISGAVCFGISSVQEKALDSLKAEPTFPGRLGIVYELFENTSVDVLLFHLVNANSVQFADPDKMKEAIGAYTASKETFDAAIIRILTESAVSEKLMPEEAASDRGDLVMLTIISMIREICFSRKTDGRWAGFDKERTVGLCLEFMKKLMAV